VALERTLPVCVADALHSWGSGQASVGIASCSLCRTVAASCHYAMGCVGVGCCWVRYSWSGQLLLEAPSGAQGIRLYWLQLLRAADWPRAPAEQWLNGQGISRMELITKRKEDA
jgi:hypothetical protein